MTDSIDPRESFTSFGPWRLASLIAVGGLGELWRASREDKGEVVALKRLHTHLARNDDVRAQFTIEQTLTTQLPRHANVVHATDAGSIAGRPYVALDLAPGEDLRRILAPPAVVPLGAPPSPTVSEALPRRRAPLADLGAGSAARSGRGDAPNQDGSAVSVLLPRARVLAIVTAAADAASHLHHHGFVHGDINPGNLMVSTADHVTLVDLGIARAIGGAGVVRGTPAYMAPEQVRGERWTPATDVFALGILLWELVSGTRLFHRGPPWLSLAAVVEAPVPALADPAVDALAQAALVKDADRRIASAAELVARLRDL
jgi:serine/threonine-protein kinase